MGKKKSKASASRAARQRREEMRRKQAMQKKLVAGLVVLLAAVGLFFAVRAMAPTDNAAWAAEISVDRAYENYQQGVFLLDVRTREEWDEYHVPGATLIPLDELPNRLNELPADQPIMVICRSGNRSQVGRDILLQGGFNATSITGGIKAWAAAGYPTVSENDASVPLPRDISIEQAYAYYQQGVFLLDVRTQEEWDEYHVPGATLIPLDELPNRLNELPAGQPIMVICRSGNRSQVGRDILLQGGFNATSITGGIKAWAAAGYPTE